MFTFTVHHVHHLHLHKQLEADRSPRCMQPVYCELNKMARNKSPIGIKAVLAGICLAAFVYHNRFLFGLPCPPPEPDFTAISNHKQLDKWLAVYEKELGDDYDAYRNHCLRVLSFTKYTLLQEKVGNIDEEVLGIALAHHDIALWTSGDLSYLEPSAAEMEKAKHNLSDDQIKVAHEIIMQHHKYTLWSSKSFSPQDALLVNAVRKADWTDFTYGVVRYGMPVGNVCEAYRMVPELGFHDVLNGMGARLSPDNLLKRLDVLKIFKW